MLHPQLPWYLAGPALGLCVIACRLAFNARLGVTGGYSEITERLRSGELGLDWRGWLIVGVLLGGTVFALIAGGPDFHGYGWLTDNLSDVVVAPVLVVSGVLIGYGAKLAGGARPATASAATRSSPRPPSPRPRRSSPRRSS